MKRRIVAGLYMSVDGVVGVTSGWQHPYFSEEMMSAIGAAITGMDAALFGRRTYEQFAQIWPGQPSDVPMADFFNSSPKYVVTSSAAPLEWGPAYAVSGDVAGQLRDLKNRDGKDILIGGSPTLVAWLLRQGLLDELNLNIMPIVVGAGLRLFEADQPVPLTLVRETTLANGTVGVTYASASGS